MDNKLDKWISKITGAKKTHKQQSQKNSNHQHSSHTKQKLRIIPLGGLDEVGKNMMVLEYEQDIVIIDMGFQFPEEDMLGVDYVIPDISYLEKKKKNIRAVLITHGHMDHIGAMPYILPKLGMPKIYATPLTRGLIEKRLEEFGLDKMANITTVKHNELMKFGSFAVSFFQVAHSIPDSSGMSIDTPMGRIIHTGDFKFDDSPAGFGGRTDTAQIKKLCEKPILALMSDSTNALRPGHTMSEKEIGENLEEVIKNTQDRIIIASFASLIGRIQQIINFAQKYKRSLFISGRSMLNNIAIAEKLGFLKVPQGLVKDIRAEKKVPDRNCLLLTTGSQGEAVSALTRISLGEHPHIKIKPKDTVVLSSKPIVGNERAIFTVINNLCLLGARVIHSGIMDVHTSGHGHQDELLHMLDLVKPRYFMPVHGEYFMRQGHGELGTKSGVKEGNILLVQNGDVIEFSPDGSAQVTDEKVDTNYIVIDGLGQGDVDSLVISDRQKMAKNGILIILFSANKKTKKLNQNPDTISRGFVYLQESQEIEKGVAACAKKAYDRIVGKKPNAKRGEIKKYVKGAVEKFTHQKLERRPLIIPVISEV